MIATIHQPQYLPWLGYFDKISKADVFVILDNVQYKKNEWQNRNRIKTGNGWQWLTVPVQYRFPEKINQVRINGMVDWTRKHLNALVLNYSKAPYFRKYMAFFEDVFSRKWDYLIDINVCFIEFLVKSLGINTKTEMASKLSLREDPTERLIDICKEVGAEIYLAGQGGSNYMDTERFEKDNIKVVFQDFQHPYYNQLFGDFEPCLSVIDLIFNHGESSLQVLKGES